MHPILFSIGNTEIHTYGIAGAIGFLVVSGIALTRSTREGLSRDGVADVIFWAAIGGLVGARALYILLNPEQFASASTWINLRTGGLVFYGALLVGLPVGGAVMARHKLPFFKVMDIFATALPLGHAISRLGCLAAGCCYGTETDLPWAVTYTDPLAAAPKGIPFHPTQAYEAAYLFGIFAVVNAFYPKKRFDGQVMALYLTTYAFCRFFNEFLRADDTRGWFLQAVFGPTISTSQAISAFVTVVALGVFVVVPRMNRTKATV